MMAVHLFKDQDTSFPSFTTMWLVVVAMAKPNDFMRSSGRRKEKMMTTMSRMKQTAIMIS